MTIFLIMSIIFIIFVKTQMSFRTNNRKKIYRFQEKNILFYSYNMCRYIDFMETFDNIAEILTVFNNT